ncbi:MAG: cobalt ECF transporter T component CbiQ [Thermodesulfobacteriota bacterium]
MPGNPEIHLSPAVTAALLGGFGATAVAVFWLLRPRTDRAGVDGAADWTIPPVDGCAEGASFFHRWDPRCKIATLFLFCFVIASLQSLAMAAMALLLALLACLLGRIPLRRALRRLAAMAGFLAMFVVVVPFTAPLRPGETLVYLALFPELPLHGGGFVVALTVVCRACAIGLLMEPMLATATLPVTLQALARLGLPAAICQMLLLVHRYVFVFLDEGKRIYRSMRIRGFVAQTNITTLRSMGNFFGMLFVRSFERTHRVYDAMLCRGYDGSFPVRVRFRTTRTDRLKILLWAMVAIFLLLFDRCPTLLSDWTGIFS